MKRSIELMVGSIELMKRSITLMVESIKLMIKPIGLALFIEISIKIFFKVQRAVIL